MRFTTRAAGLAVVAALTATVLMLRPGSPQQASARQPAAELPADLALVPADAVGFVHLRAMDLWKHEAFATFRQTFEKAGPKALAALDAQFVPKVSTFDRLTAFLTLTGERKEPDPFVVLRFTADFDPAAVAKAYLPNPQRRAVGGKTVYGGDADFEFYFPDNKHIVMAPPGALERYLARPVPKDGPLAAGLKLAASGRPLVGSLALASLPIPPKALEDLPPEVRTLLKAEHITGSIDLGAAAKVEMTAGYKNADDAQAAEKAVKALADFARKELAKAKAEIENSLFNAKGPRPIDQLPEALFMTFGLGALNQVDEMLADPGKYVKRDGSSVTATVNLPKDTLAAFGTMGAVGAGLLLPAVQKVRSAAARAQSSNNLKQIGLAIHNYHDAHGHLPQDIVDKNGKPILSWRVQILPYIEQENIYKLFKLDEPWDGPNNRKLSQIAIKTFLSPQADTSNPAGLTHYQAFVGPDTMFPPGKKIKLTDVTDGLSNTIMVVETAEAVEWAKPGGIPFDPNKPLPKLQSAGNSGVLNTLFGDGSVRAIRWPGVDEKVMKALITRNGGEVIDPDK